MPNYVRTPELALRAITALFDSTLKPLHSNSTDFVIACMADVWPKRFAYEAIRDLPTDHKFWVNNPARISTNLFGMAGDVLLWIPRGNNPDGLAAIKTPGHNLVLSSPSFLWTSTGRMQVSCEYFRIAPDIVLRF